MIRPDGEHGESEAESEQRQEHRVEVPRVERRRRVQLQQSGRRMHEIGLGGKIQFASQRGSDFRRCEAATAFEFRRCIVAHSHSSCNMDGPGSWARPWESMGVVAPKRFTGPTACMEHKRVRVYSDPRCEDQGPFNCAYISSMCLQITCVYSNEGDILPVQTRTHSFHRRGSRKVNVRIIGKVEEGGKLSNKIVKTRSYLYII